MEIGTTEIDNAIRHLAENGVHFAQGLSDAEISQLESTYQVAFPLDLTYFLQRGMPITHGFVNWRGENANINKYFDALEGGIYFDIRNRVFWWPDWGLRPQSDSEAIQIAKNFLRKAPRLIPSHGHSYISSSPPEIGSPVFSISQADAIHRGRNLAHHLLWVLHDESNEELEDDYPVYSAEYTRIHFWTDLVRANL